MHGPRNRVDEDEERIGEPEDKTEEYFRMPSRMLKWKVWKRG